MKAMTGGLNELADKFKMAAGDLSSSFPWWLLLKKVTWHHLYCVFMYIQPLLINKDLHECRNV